MNGNIQEVLLNNNSNSTNVTNITNYTSSFIDYSSSSFLNASNTTFIASQIDPNWFYSASAQSAAAIVGLMGAFLTTKVLNQKLYLKQLKNEIDEINKKYTYLVEETDQIYLRTKELLSDREIELCKSLDNTFNPSNIPSSYMLYQLEKGEGGTQLSLKLTKYREYENDISTKKGEVLFLDNVLKYKEEQLSSNKDVLDSKKHLINLSIFSLVGIFLPLFMMLLDYDIMIKWRYLIFSLICAGWFFIIVTLGFEIHNLKD
ncbi:MAG TPA: hypothetical protein C5S51_10565 [Methanosarcinaceae archaeon]|nr:hypothetical protein [Methanosarcinaceae archaeon]